MKKYIGIKHIEAEPMTMGEAYKAGLLQVGKLPDGFEKEGYRVRYDNGYESWSAKEVFEKAYLPFDTFQDRLKIEFNELFDKQVKLRNFLCSEKSNSLDDVNRGLLKMQWGVMTKYLEVLMKRIMLNKDSDDEPPVMIETSFGMAIEAIKEGFIATRGDWNNSKFICKQVPCVINKDVIPGMQSLPKVAKNYIIGGMGFIDYNNQILEYDNTTGKANSYVATTEDIFAEDWEIILSHEVS